MKRLPMLLLTLLPFACLATHPMTPQPLPQPLPVAAPIATATASPSVVNTLTASPVVNSSATAESVALAEAGAAASATNEGNTLSTSIVSQQKRQAPSGFAAASNSTAGCMKARGVFLSAPGAGLGLNGGKIDKDCTLLIAADEELRRGNLQASIQLRCATKLYRDVFSPADCLALLNTQTVAKDYATKEYVDRAFRGSLKK